MGRGMSTSWASLSMRQFKWITFSFFVGFGLQACSGSDEPEEPVAAETDGVSSDTETMPSDSGEQAPAVVDGEEALEGEDVVESADVGEPSAPPEDMDASSAASGSVNAELDSEDSGDVGFGDSTASMAPAEPVAAPAAAVEEDTSDTAMFSQPEVTAPTQDYARGTVSSPGAAMNLPSGSYSSKNNSHASSSPSSASSSSHGGDHSMYVVRSGDSLGRIASRIYGSSSSWQTLASANGLSAPYVIFPGDELKFDLSSAKAKKFATSYVHNRKTITVRKGDTLSSLAEQVFGSPAEWKMFLSYNKDKISNPNRITTGMTLGYVDMNGGREITTPKFKKKVAPAIVEKKAKPVVDEEPAAEVEDEEAPVASEDAPATATTISAPAEDTVDEVPAAVEEVLPESEDPAGLESESESESE